VAAEKILIGSMLGNVDIAQKVLKELREEDFTVLLHRQIVSAIGSLLKDNNKIDPQKVIDYLNDDKAAKLISKILIEDNITFNEKVILGCIDTIKNYKLTQEIKELEKRAKMLDKKIKKSEKIEENDLKELGEIVKQLKTRNVD